MKGLVRILSDLHLGHPASRIDEAAQLLPLLDGAATLVINGDACEQRYRPWKARGEEMLAELRAAASERAVELICLRGNHDPWVSELDYLELADGALVVIHGDGLFRHLSPWSPKVMRLSGEMDKIWQRSDSDNLDGWCEAVQACRLLKPGQRGDGEEMQGAGPLTAPFRLIWPPWRVPVMLWCWWTAPRRAEELCARFFPRAKTIVFGHTHWPGQWQRGGRSVINTGGFVSIGGARVVDVDPTVGEATVRKVDLGEVFRLNPEPRKLPTRSPHTSPSRRE